MKISRRVRNNMRLVKNRIKYNSAYAYWHPNTIYLAVNSVCNLKCIMCDVGQNNKESQFYKLMVNDDNNMDIENALKFMGQVKEFKPAIAITSTEPLLYPSLELMIKEVKKMGLSIQVTTNGLLLLEKADMLLENRVNDVWISADGMFETADIIRGMKGFFNKMNSGVKYILNNRDKSKTSVNMNFTILPMNVEQMYEFALYFSELGVDSISFSHMNFVSEDMSVLTNKLYGPYIKSTRSSIEVINPADMNTAKLQNEINRIKKDFSNVQFSPELKTIREVHDFYNKPDTIVKQQKCVVPWNIMQIMSNGDAVIMTRCYPLIMGNIYEQSYNEIWNGKEYRKFRAFMKKNKLLPACTRCCGVF